MSDEGGNGDGDGRESRQLRRLGIGTVASGLLVVAATQVLPNPYEPLVGGLGFLGIAILVFEYTEGLESGLSLGFITSGLIVWLYPVLAAEADLTFVGALLVLLGVLNVVFPPFALYFRNLGRRLGGGGQKSD